MNMQHIGLLPGQPLAQPGNIAQCAGPLPADRPVQVFGAAGANPVTQGAVRSDYGYPVAFSGCEFAQLNSDQLRSAKV